MKTYLLAAAIAVTVAPAADAGMILRACMSSDRAAASKSLCGCIQSVADSMLDMNDQRLASKFFRDPHMAQEIRQSDNQTHEIFWKKYKAFGARAEQFCG